MEIVTVVVVDITRVQNETLQLRIGFKCFDEWTKGGIGRSEIGIVSQSKTLQVRVMVGDQLEQCWNWCDPV